METKGIKKTKDRTMDRVKQAVDSFLGGFSCSQAVLSSYSESLGLSRKTALKIAQAFGGGMAHMGQTCGAVTGAFMVISLKHGRMKVEDVRAKEKTYDLVREFVRRFESSHGSIICKDLLGYDINKPEEVKIIEEKNLFEILCPSFVRNAVEILEKIL